MSRQVFSPTPLSLQIPSAKPLIFSTYFDVMCEQYRRNSFNLYLNGVKNATCKPAFYTFPHSIVKKSLDDVKVTPVPGLGNCFHLSLTTHGRPFLSRVNIVNSRNLRNVLSIRQPLDKPCTVRSKLNMSGVVEIPCIRFIYIKAKVTSLHFQMGSCAYLTRLTIVRISGSFGYYKDLRVFLSLLDWDIQTDMTDSITLSTPLAGGNKRFSML